MSKASEILEKIGNAYEEKDMKKMRAEFSKLDAKKDKTPEDEKRMKELQAEFEKEDDDDSSED